MRMVCDERGAVAWCCRASNEARNDFFPAARQSGGSTRFRMIVRMDDGRSSCERHFGGIMRWSAFEKSFRYIFAVRGMLAGVLSLVWSIRSGISRNQR